jgi:hypothetical protein
MDIAHEARQHVQEEFVNMRNVLSQNIELGVGERLNGLLHTRRGAGAKRWYHIRTQEKRELVSNTCGCPGVMVARRSERLTYVGARGAGGAWWLSNRKGCRPARVVYESWAAPCRWLPRNIISPMATSQYHSSDGYLAISSLRWLPRNIIPPMATSQYHSSSAAVGVIPVVAQPHSSHNLPQLVTRR